MKTVISIVLLIFSISNIDSVVYEALDKDTLEPIEKAIAHVNTKKSSSQKNAYIGVLTMKKAGYIKGALNKLEAFKAGKEILEREINAHPKNTEYRFLRLIIQEYAPAILKYKKDIDADKKHIIDNFDLLKSDLQKEILDYAVTSEVLEVKDFQ